MGGYDEDDYYEDWELDDREIFANPGSNSALRAATADNSRDRPCPNCGRKNILTRKDVHLGYQCNSCADQAERGGP